MDLEQKVQALEQEVQLLKSQIQSTLLDIQEYILTNAYPSLRAEESSSQNERTLPSGSARPQPNLAPSNDVRESPIVRNVSFNEPSTSEPSDSGRDVPLVRKVSLQNIKPDDPDDVPITPIVRQASPNGNTPSKSSNGTHFEAQALKPSARRPSAAVKFEDLEDVFDQEESFEEDEVVEEEAPKVVAVRKAPQAPKKASKSNGNVQRSVQPFSPSPEQPINDGVWEELEGWVHQKLEKLGASDTRELIYRLADRERLDDETKAALLTIVALYDEDMPHLSHKTMPGDDYEMPLNGKDQNQAKTRIVPETRVTLRALASADVGDSLDDEEELNDTAARSLVMRLISGVRNAGPKPKRKNTHG